MPEGLFIGLMSGTSVDSVDAALVSFEDSTFNLIATSSIQYEEDLRNTLLRLKSEPVTALADFIRLDHRVALAFSDAAITVLGKAGVTAADVQAIGSHGQTIFHLPVDQYPGTLQIGDPSLIARTTGIDVIADFRRADMAVGGQGAPLAPGFHRYALSKHSGAAVVNLGGIANVTLLGDNTIGFDTGPANSILDACAQTYLQQPFDNDGSWARAGKVHKELLQQLLGDSYFQQKPPKSTGTDYFNLNWAQQHRSGHEMSNQDFHTTLTELTAITVTAGLKQTGFTAKEVFVCGGGVRNRYLMERLSALLLPTTVQSLDAAGVSADACEACAFAWLAYQHIHALHGNIKKVTGARKEVILGALYPAGTGH